MEVQDEVRRRGGRHWCGNIVWWAVICLTVLFVLRAFCAYWSSNYGFTYVLDFGEELGLPRLVEVEGSAYIHPRVAGYDGQMYAQLALRPTATDPELVRVLDNPPYRARRIFMSWVAWAAGWGRPFAVLNAQALINVAAWLALGGLLLRWFRPGSWGDLIRWVGVMVSAGMLSSMRHALTDGPALLAIAGCIALFERGHRRMAVVVGAVAGLTRETALLVGGIFAPRDLRDKFGWLRSGCAVALMVAPLALWMWHLKTLAVAGAYHGGGFANFTWPFAGFLERWGFLLELMVQRGWQSVIGLSVLLHLAISIQMVVIVARPRWQDAWWRVGAAHVVLLALLDTQVWEDFPGAAPRVLLPLILAFNILVPRGKAWAAVLIAGNLTVFAGLMEMRPPPHEIVSIVAPTLTQTASDDQPSLTVDFGDGFLVLEGSGGRSWRWTSGDARATVQNTTAREIRATLGATVRSRDDRTLVVRAGGAEIARVAIGNERNRFQSSHFSIPAQGTVELEFLAGDAAPVRFGESRSVAVEFSAISVVAE